MNLPKQRIGIYGGAFNPIHNGHLTVAKNILESLCLDKIIFMPTGNAPHKNIKTSKTDRLNMLSLAINNNSYFEIDEYEINKFGRSYSYETLEYIKKNNAKSEIYLIVGSDEFKDIESWYRINDLLKNCILIIALRPRHDNKNCLLDYLRRIKRKYSPHVFLFDVNAPDISSSMIRDRVLLGQNIDYLTPKKIGDYIRQKNLYKHYDLRIDIDMIKNYLQDNLSPKRFIHSVCVANLAVDLAKYYGEDIFKAYIGGLLHDCAKEIPNVEKIQMCYKYKIRVDQALKLQPDLLHQFLGEKIAYERFHIRDIDILNSIRHHTTGRKRMSLLEKIVYLADYTEPNRIHDTVKYIRRLLYDNLNKALAYCLKITLDENKRKNRLIYHLSNEAFQFYKSNL